MAKHEIMIHQNTGVTKESAPYLGSYLSKETIKSDAFSAIQVQAIIAGAFDVIEELEQEGLVRIHIDGFTVCGIITGSFPTADAAFNPEKNTLQLALRLDESIPNELAAVVPAIVTDSSVTRLRVDNVMDLEAPRPYNVIHGKHVFRVAGFNMVLTDEGAGAKLVDSRGIEYELVIDEVVSKQLFKAHTAVLLEPGDYKLVVKSKAGDAEGPLQTAFRRVKYLRVADPEPTVDHEVADPGGGMEAPESIVQTLSAVFYGTNLGLVQSVAWKSNVRDEYEGIDPDAVTVNDDGTELTLTGAATGAMGDSSTTSVTVKFTSTSGRTIEKTYPYLAA